jgi:hypothetical protein
VSQSVVQEKLESSFSSTLLTSRESPVARQDTHALLVEANSTGNTAARQHSTSDKSLSLGGKGLSSTNYTPMSDEGNNSNAYAAALDAESIAPDESSLNYIGTFTPAE